MRDGVTETEKNPCLHSALCCLYLVFCYCCFSRVSVYFCELWMSPTALPLVSKCHFKPGVVINTIFMVILVGAKIKHDSMCMKPDVNHLFPSFPSAFPQCAWINVSMVHVASRASAVMTSAWGAVLSQEMQVAVWPAGTSSMGIPAWRSVLLDTMSSGAGAASASPSARLVITGILIVNS